MFLNVTIRAFFSWIKEWLATQTTGARKRLKQRHLCLYCHRNNSPAHIPTLGFHKRSTNRRLVVLQTNYKCKTFHNQNVLSLNTLSCLKQVSSLNTLMRLPVTNIVLFSVLVLLYLASMLLTQWKSEEDLWTIFCFNKLCLCSFDVMQQHTNKKNVNGLSFCS